MSIREQDIIDIYPKIMAFAFSKTRDKQKAEDLVQTTILKALENTSQNVIFTELFIKIHQKNMFL